MGGQFRRAGVAGAPTFHDRQAHEVRRFEQTEVEHDDTEAAAAGEFADDLAFANTGGTFQEHGPPRAVGNIQDFDNARADGH